HFTGGIHVDDAIPHCLCNADAPLYRTGIAIRLTAFLLPTKFFCADAPFFTAGGARIILVHQIENIHAEFFGEFVHGLLEREAALRMSGCAKSRAGTSIGENVILIRLHVRALVHVLHWAGGTSARSDARGAIADK